MIKKGKIKRTKRELEKTFPTTRLVLMA